MKSDQRRFWSACGLATISLGLSLEGLMPWTAGALFGFALGLVWLR